MGTIVYPYFSYSCVAIIHPSLCSVFLPQETDLMYGGLGKKALNMPSYPSTDPPSPALLLNAYILKED